MPFCERKGEARTPAKLWLRDHWFRSMPVMAGQIECLRGFLSFSFLSCFFLRLFRFPFPFLSVIIMKIQVKNTLTKSRNPHEHEMRIENKKGDIVHNLNDGYYLIEFELKIKKIVKIDRKKIVKNVKLQWYVHENDFFIADITSVRSPQ